MSPGARVREGSIRQPRASAAACPALSLRASRERSPRGRGRTGSAQRHRGGGRGQESASSAGSPRTPSRSCGGSSSRESTCRLRSNRRSLRAAARPGSAPWAAGSPRADCRASAEELWRQELTRSPKAGELPARVAADPPTRKRRLRRRTGSMSGHPRVNHRRDSRRPPLTTPGTCGFTESWCSSGICSWSRSRTLPASVTLQLTAS